MVPITSMLHNSRSAKLLVKKAGLEKFPAPEVGRG
jgi:hypothetical protein